MRESLPPQPPMPPLELSLTPEPLDEIGAEWDARFGAAISFFGVVRGLEGGAKIAGIEYTAYPAMVEKSAVVMGETAAREFAPHRAQLVHRTGFVAVAEPSVRLQVSSAHSGDAFEICRWYLAELKRSVPIWKQFVTTAP